MICLYHLDDDGKCAAAVVKYFGLQDNHGDKFVEMNYGRPVPFDLIQRGEMVYIVDFSIEPEEMKKLLTITENVIWIDHHFTAIQKYEGFPASIKGVRCTDCSGCMLTYLYLTNKLNLCEKAALGMITDEVPKIVQYCDDYDMWTFRLSQTKEFHFGFGTISHEPEDPIWQEHLCSPVVNFTISDIIARGDIIRQYRASLMKDLIDSYGWESKLDGYSCFCLNQGLISSDDFDCIDVSKYDILVGVIYDGSKYIYSLRSTKVNVGDLAVKHGGGGHKEASGFIDDSLIV